MALASIVKWTKWRTGVDRRKSRRLEAKYPACITFVSPYGVDVERYAETRNVSAEGALLASTGLPPSGTHVEMQIGIPSSFAASLPGAQLNVSAEVVRSESVDITAENMYGSMIALRFLGKPTITTNITMFD